MRKSLLPLLLVLTQLSSWSGPALWLCICGSGRACIVADPQTCNCCQKRHPAGTPCSDAENGTDECGASDCPTTGDSVLTYQSSGCPHFQLSHHQGAVVGPAKFADDAARFVAEIAGPGSVVDGFVRVPETPVFWLPPAPKPTLTDLAHVVLRC